MKKLFTLAAAVATGLIMTSCGMGTGAKETLGTLAAGMLTGSAATNTGSTGGNLAATGLNLLSSLLGGNLANSNTIVGTWTYAKPEVTFESNNVLSSIGGELAGNKVESMLGTQLEKLGLKAGVSTFTFEKDGKLIMSAKGQQVEGTYKLDGNTLTMQGGMGLTNVKATISIKGNQLYMLFDANTLFNAMTKLGSNSSTISSLLGNFNGMKLGWSMTK